MYGLKLSKRLPKDLNPSPFFEEFERAKSEVLEKCSSGASERLPFIDMTVSSPVRVGLPVELDSAVDDCREKFGHWSPDASGWREAREAVARYYRERGGDFTPNQIIITASTSEAYSVLFKTFCDPGDVILTPMPGYPLLDTLAQLEHLECAPYFLKLARDRGSSPEARGLKTLAQLKKSLDRAKQNIQNVAVGLQNVTAESRSLKPHDAACHAERSSQGGNETSCSSRKVQNTFRFVLDTDSLLAAPERTRILLLVSPHNPTGHIVSLAEWNEIVRFCEENNLILVVDEVFGDYGFSDEVKRSWRYLRREAGDERRMGLGVGSEPSSPLRCKEDGERRDDEYFDCGGNDLVFAPIDGPKCPIFWLNGLSKAVGAPQIKFGWMACYAPRENFEQIRAALEFVEDAYLSTSSCAQSLAVPLLDRSASYESVVRERLLANWNALNAAFSSKYCPRVLGGWYAVLRLGEDDEELALRILREQHVLVQPGFFFDFEEDGWVVVSLLQDPSLFAEAVRRLASL